MILADKILNLRKQSGMSQEEVAEKINVSRQTISRWEMGTAQPDASNLLRLSKLFDVTADYLINNEYENEKTVPIMKGTEKLTKRRIMQRLGLCSVILGFVGNFIIYIVSRTTKVMVPYITYDSKGTKWYNWSGDRMAISYKYFIQAYNLEFLVVIFLSLVMAGVFIVFMNKEGKEKKRL